jgi:hypothetical protein
MTGSASSGDPLPYTAIELNSAFQSTRPLCYTSFAQLVLRFLGINIHYLSMRTAKDMLRSKNREIDVTSTSQPFSRSNNISIKVFSLRYKQIHLWVQGVVARHRVDYEVTWYTTVRVRVYPAPLLLKTYAYSVTNAETAS